MDLSCRPVSPDVSVETCWLMITAKPSGATSCSRTITLPVPWAVTATCGALVSRVGCPTGPDRWVNEDVAPSSV
jgi:hypothetical protein